MTQTRYFFFIKSYHKKSPDYMKSASVHRLRVEGRGLYPERWNPKSKEWEINNNLLAFSGIGGDHYYEETTEAEAMKFLSSHTRLKGDE